MGSDVIPTQRLRLCRWRCELLRASKDAILLRPILRDAVLRTAPQDDGGACGRDCDGKGGGGGNGRGGSRQAPAVRPAISQ